MFFCNIRKRIRIVDYNYIERKIKIIDYSGG